MKSSGSSAPDRRHDLSVRPTKKRTGSPKLAGLQNQSEAAPVDLSEIAETDFRGAKRNPYVVLLAPDILALFPSTDAVNQALRQYARERGLVASQPK